MPTNETARKLYFNVLKPLLPDKERLRLISYLDFPIRDEFDHEIRTWIHLSNGVIAIVDKNALNVIYEIGVTVGFGKPVILIAPSPDDVPAMLRAKNVITYNPEDPASDQVRDKVKKILNAILHGTFIDQRFQDHTSVLINKAGSPVCDDEPPTHDGSASPEGDELESGLYFYRAKNYDKAAFHLERAMEAGNRDTDTYFYLADAFFFLGESLPPGERQRKAYQKMQHFSHEGTRFHPNDKRLRKTLGLSCMKLGDFDRAEKMFRELLAEDPEYTVATYNLACLHALQQNKSHCLRYLSDVFAKNSAWRYLARLDSDFDGVWDDELIQRVMFPCPIDK
jgi:tetratricopeptide (TPR) repeat protein